MKNMPSITILTGGVGPEREISLLTGKALLHSLKNFFDVSIKELKDETLPNLKNLENTVVFPAIHGTFGEDGRLQEMLENIGLNYAGSDSDSSRLCMNKYESKRVVHSSGVRIARDLKFNHPQKLDVNEVLGAIGPNAIIKPVDQGSSVGLHVIKGESELLSTLNELEDGDWMIEKRIFGRELTVGILDDSPMGVVEVIPKGGLYDYERKYSSGETEYRYPAVLDCQIENEVKAFSQFNDLVGDISEFTQSWTRVLIKSYE